MSFTISRRPRHQMLLPSLAWDHSHGLNHPTMSCKIEVRVPRSSFRCRQGGEPLLTTIAATTMKTTITMATTPKKQEKTMPTWSKTIRKSFEMMKKCSKTIQKCSETGSGGAAEKRIYGEKYSEVPFYMSQ